MYHLIDYVWCVEKFNIYFEPHKQEVYPLLTSPTFAYKNTRWVLNLYPEGLGDSASHGYISLFIKYVSEDPETINAKVELSLLNNKNERVYCRDTGDHQYQTFIDFGYKQFLKMHDIKEQREDLISTGGVLKVFARVEFEHASLPSSLTWSNYDLLLFKENFKDLYETKNLSDIIVKVISRNNTTTSNTNTTTNSNISMSQAWPSMHMPITLTSKRPITFETNSRLFHPYIINNNNNNSAISSNNSTQQQPYASKLKKASSNNNSNRTNNYDGFNNNSGGILNSYLLANTTSNSFHGHDFNSFNNDTNNDLNEFQTNFSSSPLLPFNSSSQQVHTPPLLSSNDMTSMSILHSSSLQQPPDEVLEIKSHKFILASRSGKFRELLKTNLLKLRSAPSVSCCCTCTCNNIPDNCTINNSNSLDQETNASTSTFAASSSSSSSSSDFYSPSGHLLYSPCTSTPAGSSSSSSSSSSSHSSTSKNCPFHNYIYCECGAAKQKNDDCLSLSLASPSLSTPSNLNDISSVVDFDNSISSSTTAASNDINDLLIIETNRSPKVIEYLIRYMYTGYLDTLDIYAKDIYEISKEYKVHGLTNLAREYIIKELNIQNCCDYLVFCVVNNDYELNNKIQSFITENYDTIVKTNAYKQAKRKYRELFENTFNEISKKNTHF